MYWPTTVRAKNIAGCEYTKYWSISIVISVKSCTNASIHTQGNIVLLAVYSKVFRMRKKRGSGVVKLEYFALLISLRCFSYRDLLIASRGHFSGNDCLSVVSQAAVPRSVVRYNTVCIRLLRKIKLLSCRIGSRVPWFTVRLRRSTVGQNKLDIAKISFFDFHKMLKIYVRGKENSQGNDS